MTRVGRNCGLGRGRTTGLVARHPGPFAVLGSGGVETRCPVPASLIFMTETEAIVADVKGWALAKLGPTNPMVLAPKARATIR